MNAFNGPISFGAPRLFGIAKQLRAISGLSSLPAGRTSDEDFYAELAMAPQRPCVTEDNTLAFGEAPAFLRA